MSQLEGSSVLITGGTGSLGRSLIDYLLSSTNVRRIAVFSRDELKQLDLRITYKNDPRLRWFLGDIRDLERLKRAFHGVDYVIHAAALKQVDTGEYNPMEFIKTNVLGSQNVIDASIDAGVKRVVALSTDKASSPINLYGATKLTSDKLFVAGNSYAGKDDTRFAVVRYGNVMGSRGSIIPFLLSIANNPSVPITDDRMTRFMITLEQGVELVWKALDDMTGGEIYVKKIPSMKITDVARAVAPNAKHELIGIRPGEKLHEQMISPDDAPHTYSYGDYYKILPAIHNWSSDAGRIGDGVPVGEGFDYSSDNNPEWMSVEALQQWIETNKSKIGSF